MLFRCICAIFWFGEPYVEAHKANVEAHEAYVEVHRGYVEVHKAHVEVHRALANYRNPRKSSQAKVNTKTV